jgi:hypothetical protein
MTVRSRQPEMRALFVVYLAFVVTGLVYCTTIGVLQR